MHLSKATLVMFKDMFCEGSPRWRWGRRASERGENGNTGRPRLTSKQALLSGAHDHRCLGLNGHTAGPVVGLSSRAIIEQAMVAHRGRGTSGAAKRHEEMQRGAPAEPTAPWTSRLSISSALRAHWICVFGSASQELALLLAATVHGSSTSGVDAKKQRPSSARRFGHGLATVLRGKRQARARRSISSTVASLCFAARFPCFGSCRGAAKYTANRGSRECRAYNATNHTPARCQAL